MATSNHADDSTDSPTPDTTFSGIVSVKKMEAFLDPITTLVDECKLRPVEDGLSVEAVDPANVGMARSTLRAGAFESYTPSGGVLGINVNRLADIVGMGNSGDLIQFDLDPETRKLHIEIEGLSYTLALIDPDSIRSEPDIPELDLPAEVTITGEDFDRGLKAVDMVTDHIRFRYADDALHIQGEGDTDDVDLERSRDELVAVAADGDANSLFSLDYMKDMGKAIPKDAELTLRLGEEFPIKMSYERAEGDVPVTFMLAPRIQS